MKPTLICSLAAIVLLTCLLLSSPDCSATFGPAGRTANAREQAQNPPAHVDAPAIDASPADVGSIEGMLSAVYACISGTVGTPRQWSRFRTLFDPNARFLATRVNLETHAVTPVGRSVQEFVDAGDVNMTRNGFTERELGHAIHRFGNVASVLSGYEGTLASTGQVAGRGVNFIQLYFDGKRWWVLTIAWDTERPDNPIPAELQSAK
jgi:hypothetical protein